MNREETEVMIIESCGFPLALFWYTTDGTQCRAMYGIYSGMLMWLCIMSSR